MNEKLNGFVSYTFYNIFRMAETHISSHSSPRPVEDNMGVDWRCYEGFKYAVT